MTENYSSPCAFGMFCVGMMVGAGFAWGCAWLTVAVVTGALSAGFVWAAAVCCDDGSATGLAVTDSTGFTGSAAAFDASGLGFGTGTLRLATRGTEAGGRGPLPRWADGSSGPGGPYAEFRTPS